MSDDLLAIAPSFRSIAAVEEILGELVVVR